MSMTMRNRQSRTAMRSQNGFALMMVMFLTTLVLLGAMAAAPYIRTERQREREQEMIWRGKQYVRGIKLYYRKTGRFPTSVDDLIKPKLGSLRFMHQAYKDPMNKNDGAWRLIYIGPAGQLIGSLKPPRTFQLPGQPGTPAGANPQQTTSFGASGFGQSPPAQAGSQQAQQGATQAGTNDGEPGSEAASNAQTDEAGDKAMNYRLLEFVWNPSKDLTNALNQQMATPNQNPQGTDPAQSGFGQQNKTPANAPSMPMPTPAPTQNPPQP